MKKTSGIIIIILLHFNIYSQNDLRDGYIITNNNDTLQGMIEFRGDMKNSKSCLFFTENKTFAEYKPYEIHSYRFIDGKYYISRFVQKKDTTEQIFAEYLVNGSKDLFYYRDLWGFHFLLELNDSTIKEVPYKEEIIRKNGKSFIYKSKQHIGYLKVYFEDCPEIFSKIDRINIPDTKNLIDLTTKYHELTCENETCVVYNKPQSAFKIGIQPYFTTIKYKSYSDYIKQFGGLVYLWLPRSNENLYLKTGVLFSDINNYKIYRIPIHMEYQFPGHFILPKFDLGVNAFFGKYYEEIHGYTASVESSFGSLFRISKNLFINIDFSVDLFYLNYETDFIVSHSLNGGLFIKI